MAYLERIVDKELADDLAAMGAAVIEGPKACGKTVTGQHAAASEVRLDVDPKARQAAFEALEKAGQWTKPEFGSMWIHMSGATKEQARMHITIAVPGATEKSLGFPENGTKGGVWIMQAGSSAAHLMTPGS